MLTEREAMIAIRRAERRAKEEWIWRVIFAFVFGATTASALWVVVLFATL